jgi:hypothetical protein
MDADGSNLVRIGPGPKALLAWETGYSYYGIWQPINE